MNLSGWTKRDIGALMKNTPEKNNFVNTLNRMLEQAGIVEVEAYRLVIASDLRVNGKSGCISLSVQIEVAAALGDNAAVHEYEYYNLYMDSS